jgi:hypothetical protein
MGLNTRKRRIDCSSSSGSPFGEARKQDEN